MLTAAFVDNAKKVALSYLERRFLQDVSEENRANVKTMRRNYMIFHTMDPELAIDNLIEIKKQKQSYRYMKASI
jgi:hypothetical protein